MLIINADDWGRSREETDSAFECFRAGRVTSVSAMVFMPDSARAAKLALEAGLDVGLHFNLTQSYGAVPSLDNAARAHARIARFLGRNRYMWLLYNPLLRQAIRSTWEMQFQEFARLYGRPPSHVDGHQHMHLAMNVLFANLIPTGMKVRGTFSFSPGERPTLHRAYRSLINRRLARGHTITDYFFCLGQSIRSGRLSSVIGLARTSSVELMTHPIREHEKHFLLSAALLDELNGIKLGSYADLDAPHTPAPASA